MLWWNLQRLKSKNPQTRRQTVEAIVATGSASALEPLKEVLKDEDAEVRVAAAKGLGSFKDERAVTPLISSLVDRHPQVRATAAQSLRQLGDARAISSLVSALKDEDHNVRWQSANALNSLGWKPETDTEFVLRSVAMGQPDDAVNYGKAAVEALEKILKDKTCPRRRAAATALGKTGDINAVKVLEYALRDEDGQVRVAAVEALSQIGHAPSANALLPLLRDNDRHVRAVAIEALGRMGDVRIVEPIAQFLLDDSSWDVRKLSVEALGRIRHDRATELLCRALSDDDHDVRQTAANSLGQIPDPRAVGPLVLTLKDANSSVRQAAKAALGQIDRQWELSEAAQSVIPQLEAALKDKDYWVSQSAADTLAKIKDMRQRIQDTSTVVNPEKQRREFAITVLSDTLRDIDRDLRQAAAEALGRLGDIAVVGPLVAALDDQDEWVGRAAALALNHLNWMPGPEDGRRSEKMKALMYQI